jgi:hypothetical protein
MGGGITVGPNWIQRERHDLDPCAGSQSLCRNSLEVRAAAGFRMWSGTGMSKARHPRTVYRDNTNLGQTTSKQAKKAKANLDANYSYLGGNAFGRDSKGRIKKDDQATAQDLQTAGHLGEQEYSAYVYYEFEIV